MKLDPDESIVSFDVSAVFTSIPVQESLEVVKELLERDNSWKSEEAENLKTENVIQLLDFCLSTTYFFFFFFFFCREKFHQQKDGCAMGSPCSPLVVNAYMEYFEKRALDSAPHTPRIWKRYVDDTFCVIKSAYIDEFTDHINNQYRNIKFTREEEEGGTLPFLDTVINKLDDGSVKIKIFRKPTQTDQYFHFRSHHTLEHKLSVVRTLLHRSELALILRIDLRKSNM